MSNQVIRELAKVKAMFQQRAILAAMGVSSEQVEPVDTPQALFVLDDGNGYERVDTMAMRPYVRLSSVVNVYDEHQPAHWEWLISFSSMGKKRLSNEEIKICLKDFGAVDFMEDNHEPGVARKFWLAVDEKYRVPCPCQDEAVIVEGDYRYSVKKEEAV